MSKNYETIEHSATQTKDRLRIVIYAFGASALSLSLISCSTARTADSHYDFNYAATVQTPHEMSSIIPNGKAFPPVGHTEIIKGEAMYISPADITIQTGITAIDAYCGNPVNHSDKKKNLYVSITGVRQGQRWVAPCAITDFPACTDDGKLEDSELRLLQ